MATSDYRQVYHSRVKNGQAKKSPSPSPSFDTKTAPPYILDEGGVPIYQLPTEKTRDQTVKQVEQA